MDSALGGFIGESVNRFIAKVGIARDDIVALGSHGQTVRHRPELANPFTWQIGDPNRIAEITGIDTVADFRRRDMAAGGQGAPLVPPFHEALFRSPEEFRVVVNIGGISNVTVLPQDPDAPVTGFDTGPGNCLLDAWCERQTGNPFDRDGEWARSGRAGRRLLRPSLGSLPLAPPPKSTGREYFNLALARQYNRIAPGMSNGRCWNSRPRRSSTAIDEWANPCERLIVCGGAPQ